MQVVLAEKKSVAGSIAKILGATTTKDGYFEGNGYQVAWARGHLVELEDPQSYNPAWKTWDYATLPMIPVTFKLRAINDDSIKKQLGVIKQLFEQSSVIISATDAGREGELIFRYIAEYLGFSKKPFKRLWISSLTDEAIKSGFANLKNGAEFDNLHKAAQCRSEADWLVGINATRAHSIKTGGQKVLSVGRVQTPVLSMIAQRDNEIEKFVPKDFWELHSIYKGADFLYTGGRFDKKSEAESKFSKITGAKLVIASVSGKSEQVLPPLLYDLTDLQKDMNNSVGLTADQTLTAVQTLYEKKHVTYPRTDSRYLTSDMQAEMPSLITVLCSLFADKSEFVPAGATMPDRYFNNDKVTDHHAIIPTNVSPSSSGLSDIEHSVYEAIVTRFIAAFLPAQIKRVTTVLATINGEEFKTTGTVIEVMGWKALYANGSSGDETPKNEKLLPRFEQGESGAQEPKITQGKTTPPKRYTEATLLAMMESAGKVCESEEQRDIMKEKGLGTPATRANVIELLIKRKFIERRKKEVVSTEDGRALINLIQTRELKSPELTGDWEVKLKMIEQGKYNPDLFMQEIATYTQKIKDDLAAVEVKHVIENAIADCPQCKNGKIIESEKSFNCSDWRNGCKFSIWKEIAGKKIPLAIAKQLLTKGKTDLLTGFKKKDGIGEFSAMLKLTSGKVEFDFPPRK